MRNTDKQSIASLLVQVICYGLLLTTAGCKGFAPNSSGETASDGSKSTTETSNTPGAPGSPTNPTTPTPTPTPNPNTPPSQTPPKGRSVFTSSGGKGGLAVTPGQFAVKQLTPDAASKYYIYVPPQYKEGTPIGMVLIYHGVTSNPTDFAEVLEITANKDRFILVAPLGDQADGTGGASCQEFGREAMMAVRGAYNIDDAKQYIVGHSAGSTMTVYLGLTSKAQSLDGRCGARKVQVGFQSDFAAVGFSSPVASPPGSGLESKTVAQLGYTPAMWSEYGELSADGGQANALYQFGKAKGYNAIITERKGEGHAPAAPYSNYVKMFDLFEKTLK